MAVAGGDALRGVPYPIALPGSQSLTGQNVDNRYAALAEELFASSRTAATVAYK